MSRDTLRCFPVPTEPRYCRAVIDNLPTRCQARPEPGREVCKRCRTRIHQAMSATLYNHGAFKLAADLDTLYKDTYR